MQNKIILYVFICSIISCKDSDKNTIVFSNYLSKEFDTRIPDSLHYFILIPKLMCKGCSANTLSELKNVINNNERHITFISTNDKIIPDDFNRKVLLLHDSIGDLDNLDLDIANITIVKTKQNKVIFIKPIYADEKQPLSKTITF